MKKKIFIILLFILCIAVIGIAIKTIYDISEENLELSSQIENLQEKIINIEKEPESSSNFDDLMDALYFDQSFYENYTTYKNYVFAYDTMLVTDENGNSEEEYFNVTLEDDGTLTFYTDYSETLFGFDLDSATGEITGIDGEVVDIQLYYGVTPSPTNVIFLTRDGDIYNLTVGTAIYNNDYEATKISDISQVIKIEILDSQPDDAMEGTQSIMAIYADGTYEDITNYLY